MFRFEGGLNGQTARKLSCLEHEIHQSEHPILQAEQHSMMPGIKLQRAATLLQIITPKRAFGTHSESLHLGSSGVIEYEQ